MKQVNVCGRSALPVVVALLLAISALFAASILSGCKLVGVEDVEVRLASGEIVDALQNVVDVAEIGPSEALVWIGIASSKASALLEREGDKALSDLDKRKVTRLMEGLADLVAEIEDTRYVRLRAKSLMALAASLSLYDNSEGLAKLKTILENRDDAEDNEPSDPR